MSRLKDALLTGAYADGLAPMLDLQYGGQHGYAPNPIEYVSNQSYVRRNLVCLLMQAPLGFRYLPDPQFWVSTLKAMVERHALRWEGLKAGLTANFTETAVSGGGEMQEDLTNITRERSTPSCSLKDKYGRPMQKFIWDWMTHLGMDPDTKVPNIATMLNGPTDLLSDISTATMLFFEPDPSFTSVDKAWLVSNMFPKATGDIEGVRDLREDGEPSEITIEWTGVAQSNIGVRAFAQTLLNNINITNANPYLQPAFMQQIAADVAGPNGGIGYKELAEQLGANAIQRA